MCTIAFKFKVVNKYNKQKIFGNKSNLRINFKTKSFKDN